MDGASGWQVFRYVTLPLLLPLILTVTLLRLIDLLKVYAQIWVLFGNLVNTRVLNIHLYTLGLGTHEYGKASALGVLTLLAVMLFTWLLLPLDPGRARAPMTSRPAASHAGAGGPDRADLGFPDLVGRLLLVQAPDLSSPVR